MGVLTQKHTNVSREPFLLVCLACVSWERDECEKVMSEKESEKDHTCTNRGNTSHGQCAVNACEE